MKYRNHELGTHGLAQLSRGVKLSDHPWTHLIGGKRFHLLLVRCGTTPLLLRWLSETKFSFTFFTRFSEALIGNKGSNSHVSGNQESLSLESFWKPGYSDHALSPGQGRTWIERVQAYWVVLQLWETLLLHRPHRWSLQIHRSGHWPLSGRQLLGLARVACGIPNDDRMRHHRSRLKAPLPVSIGARLLPHGLAQT